MVTGDRLDNGMTVGVTLTVMLLAGKKDNQIKDSQSIYYILCFMRKFDTFHIERYSFEFDLLYIAGAGAKQ